MTQASQSRLILPQSVVAQRQAAEADSVEAAASRKVTLPPELLEEARRLFPEATGFGEQLRDFLAQGPAAALALLGQDSFKGLIQDQLSGVFPHLMMEAYRRDRMNLIHSLSQVMQNEMARVSISSASELPAYQRAFAVAQAVISQVNPLPLNASIEIPDYGLRETLVNEFTDRKEGGNESSEST